MSLGECIDAIESLDAIDPQYPQNLLEPGDTPFPEWALFLVWFGLGEIARSPTAIPLQRIAEGDSGATGPRASETSCTRRSPASKRQWCRVAQAVQRTKPSSAVWSRARRQ